MHTDHATIARRHIRALNLIHRRLPDWLSSVLVARKAMIWKQNGRKLNGKRLSCTIVADGQMICVEWYVRWD